MGKFLEDLHKIFFGDKNTIQIPIVEENKSQETTEKAVEDILIMRGKPVQEINEKALFSGDVVKIFGYKAKLKIREDQNGDKPYIGYNAKDKPIRFKHEEISSITRSGKIVFQRYEEV